MVSADLMCWAGVCCSFKKNKRALAQKEAPPFNYYKFADALDQESPPLFGT
jgi:hypothetical protein